MRTINTAVLAIIIGVLLAETIIVDASASEQQASQRQLLQGDPFTVFNEPAPPASAGAASGGPSVNTNGVPAVSNSATQVPVLGSPFSAFQQPAGSLYATQLAAVAQQRQTAVQPQTAGLAAQRPAATAQPAGTGPQTALPANAAAALPAAGATIPVASATPAVPTVAADATVAAVPGTSATQPVLAPLATTALAAPAAQQQAQATVTPAPENTTGAPNPPAPTPVQPNVSSPSPSPPPPPPPPPMPPGMIHRDNLTGQIPANATALREAKILLPEGASSSFSFAWVCDAKGGLYLSVNRDYMITCGDGTIDLNKTLNIDGAKPVTCPDTKQACPGNTAVIIVTQFANTSEQFQKQQDAYVAGIAKAASVPETQVVVTNVRQLLAPSAAQQLPVNSLTAAATGALGLTVAQPASGVAAVPGVSPLRKLLQAVTSAVGSGQPAAAAAVPGPGSFAAGGGGVPIPMPLEAAAVVEEIPGGPRPLIEVTTSIQPMRESEADNVLNATEGSAFLKTFEDTLSATKLILTGDMVARIAEPAQEFVWMQPGVAALPGQMNATLGVPNATGFMPMQGMELNTTAISNTRAARRAQNSAASSGFSIVIMAAMAALGAAVAL